MKDSWKPLVYLVSVTTQGSKMQWKFSCNGKIITTSALTIPCWERGESDPLIASRILSNITRGVELYGFKLWTIFHRDQYETFVSNTIF